MHPTTTQSLRFPRLLSNQNFAGTYFVIPLEDLEQMMPDPLPVINHLIFNCGWGEVNNAAAFLTSSTGEGPLSWQTREEFGYKRALVKEYHNSQLYRAHGDLREALGMPRESKFATISEVSISLIFPHAIHLPTDIEKDLHNEIFDKIKDYVKLGQASLQILNNYGDNPAVSSIIIRGQSAETGGPMIAIVTEVHEWQDFFTAVSEIFCTALNTAMGRDWDRVNYDQTLEAVTA